MNMDKIKKFVKEHEEVVTVIVVGAFMYTVGYKTGLERQTQLMKQVVECCMATPE